MSDYSVRELPLFPLPDVVLFPQQILPLHIFESRYRMLLQSVLESDKRFGIVRIDPETGEMADVGCCAEVLQHQTSEDGRSYVVTLGQQRFRLLNITRDTPYRTAMVSWIEDEPVDEPNTISKPNLFSENQSPEKALPEEGTQPEVVITVPESIDTGSNQKKLNIWTGTVADAEEQFITELIHGIDTVIDANSKQPFSGRMKILNQNGSLMGEVNLLDGQLHGEKTFMSETGVVTERNIWEKGIRIK